MKTKVETLSSATSLLAPLEEELLLVGPEEGEERLRCQLALLRWDGGAAAQAVELLAPDAAPGPLAAELRRHLLLERGAGSEAAEAMAEEAQRLEESRDPRAGALWAAAAEHQLFWCLDARRAAELCERALAAPRSPPDLGELLELALGVAGDLEALARRALTEDLATLPTLVNGAVALVDGLGRPELAIDLLLRAFDLDSADPLVIELLLELSALFPEAIGRHRILEQKRKLLARYPEPSADSQALAAMLCRVAVADGDVERARELLAEFSATSARGDPEAAPEARWAAVSEAMLRRDVAALGHDRPALSAAYRELAKTSAVAPLSRVYRLRAAQVGEHAGYRFAELDALLVANLEESSMDFSASTMLQRLRLQHGWLDGLCEQYQSDALLLTERKGQLLRWAALIAEGQLHDPALAASLRRDAAAAQPDPLALGDLQRLYRAAGAWGRLADVYRRQAEVERDPEAVATLLVALAALELRQGRPDEAAQAARSAMVAVGEDRAALGILASIHREAGDAEALREVLTTQLDVLRAPSGRLASLRELARLERDPQVARRYLEQARMIDEGDTATLTALAELYESGGDLGDAATLREALARAVTEAGAAARAFADAGRLHRDAGEPQAAISALREALRCDPQLVEARESLLALLRQSDDGAGLIAELRRSVEQQSDERTLAALWRELATLHETAGGDDEATLEAFVAAVRLDPGDDATLLAFARWCRAREQWRMLAGVLATLPIRPLVLDLRGEALEQLQEWDALIPLREQLLALAITPRDSADRAYDLGRAFESAREIAAARQAYERGVAAVPDHRASLRALQRVHQAAGDTAALADVLARELAVEQEPGRQADLLLDLGRCCEQRGDLEEAAAHLEQALTGAPHHADVIEMLERIYEQNSPRDHARLLKARAETQTDAAERSELHLRAAEIFAAHEDDAGATAAYLAAMEAAPGNREGFTSFEQFAYQRGRWRELMEVYELAIDHVERGGARAYRLSDLYGRKGQLQLERLAQPGEAAASFLKVLEYDPKSLAAMDALQRLFVAQQDWRGLIHAYEHRAAQLPDNELFRAESLRQAARLASEHLPADDADTARLWREVFESDPRDDEAARFLERALTHAGEHGELAAVLERRLQHAELAEDAVAGYRRLAELVEQRLDDPERAIRAYEGIRAFAEHDEHALRALARLYEATERWEPCIEVLRDLVIIEADPEERSLLYFKCGSVAEARFGDDDTAIAYYEESLAESPGCLPAIHGLRDIYLRRGQWYDALRTLEHELRLWEGEREEAGVLARMAEIRLVHMNDEQKAIEEFEDALALDPDCRIALRALFDLYFERGERGRAVGLAERLAAQLATEGDPRQRSEFFFRRGMLLAEEQATLGLAAESLVTALSLAPGKLEALDALVQLFRRSPETFDYAQAFRELEQIHRTEGDAAATAHVLVAAGAVNEVAGDADAALENYAQAEQLAPDDLTPTRAAADLLVRLNRQADAVARVEALLDRSTDASARVAALVLIGDIWADDAMNAEQAAQRYAEALSLDPTRAEVSVRLAESLVLLERYPEAERIIEQLISEGREAGQPDGDLAQHYYYLGVIQSRGQSPIEGAGSFRRALQLDPACVEAALALSRSLVEAGTRDAAEELLEHTIHEASRRPGGAVPLDLRRNLGGLYLGAGRFDEALALYDTIIREGGGQAEDHLTVAGIHALDDASIPQAIAELEHVIEQDPLDAQAEAFGMLAQLHDRVGDLDRVIQVLQVAELLGSLTAAERGRLAQLRDQLAAPIGRGLTDRMRQQLRIEEQDAQVARTWGLCREALDRVFPLELPRARAEAIEQAGGAEARATVDGCMRLLGMQAVVQVADQVPGGVAADAATNRVLVDRVLLAEPAAALAFCVARALELLRAGNALLGRLAFDDRMMLVELLNGLLDAPRERSDLAVEFLRRLPQKAAEQIDEGATLYQQQLAAGAPPQQAQRWLAGVERCANQVGLVACGDIGAALRTMALLSAEEGTFGPDGELLVPAVPDGVELVRFALSARYAQVRQRVVARA